MENKNIINSEEIELLFNSAMDELNEIKYIWFIEKENYLNVLNMLQPRFTGELDSACVRYNPTDNTFSMFINPSFFMVHCKTRTERMGLLYHEMLHFICLHFYLSEKIKNKYIYNIAADVVVNEYVKKVFQIPEGGVTANSISKILVGVEFDADDFYSTHSMYTYLLKYKNILEECSFVFDHQYMNVGDDPEKEEEFAKAYSKFYKGFGDLTSELMIDMPEFIKDQMKSKVNWSTVLHQFISNSSTIDRKKSLLKKSKRYGSGFPGSRKNYKKKILLAVDTSGSIGRKELSIFRNEIDTMHHMGYELDIFPFDVESYEVFPYSPEKFNQLKGGGGTDFNAPVNYLNKSNDYEALIVFTDGESQCTISSDKNIMWVIVGNQTTEKLPGEVLYVD